MERKEIINGLKAFFSIDELVDKSTYKAHGDRAWKFFDTDLLHAILIIRVNLDKPMTINNWIKGGKFSQRGLRTNICSIVRKKTESLRLYLSAHVLGKGIDFDVSGMIAEDVRIWIKENKNLFPFKIRLEWKFNSTGKAISWVHLDTFSEEKNPKVYLFNV